MDELVEKAVSVPGVHHVLATPVLTAILVVLIFMIVAYLVVRPHWKGDFWTAFLRLGIYSAAGAMVVMSLHHRVKSREYRKQVGAEQDDMAMVRAADVNVGGDLDIDLEKPAPRVTFAQPVVQPPQPVAQPAQPVVQYAAQPAQQIVPVMMAPPSPPIAMYTTQPQLYQQVRV